MRKTKIKTAKSVRQVKAGLSYQVDMGIITKKQKRETLLTIGKRMRKGY